MKVIDLLNKIANGEEVPKEIKYDTMNYYFRNYDYKEVHGELIDEQTSFIERINFYRLNDEIKIIEEEKEIEELNLMFPICNDIKNAELGGFASIYKSNLINIKYKIDEIIDELNKIKKEVK